MIFAIRISIERLKPFTSHYEDLALDRSVTPPKFTLRPVAVVPCYRHVGRHAPRGAANPDLPSGPDVKCYSGVDLRTEYRSAALNIRRMVGTLLFYRIV